MQRIGIAASKISKGSLFNYNLCVVLIASFFSLFIFLICGLSIFFILFMISLIIHAMRPVEFHWVRMFKICMIVLGAVIAVFDIVAIFKNIQFNKK